MTNHESFLINNSAKYLCLFLSASKVFKECKIVLDFFTAISDICLQARHAPLLQIKLKWYLDALNNKNIKGHKLLDNAMSVFCKYNIDIALVSHYILSKNIDADCYPFKSMFNIIEYCQSTEEIVWLVISEIINQTKLSCAEKKIISDIGVSYGLIGLLRNLPFNTQRNINPLLFNSKEEESDESSNLVIDRTKAIVNIADDITKKIFLNKKHLNKKIYKLVLLSNFNKIYIGNIIKNNYIISSSKIEQINLFNKLWFLYKVLFI